jgi:hypothetical protein
VESWTCGACRRVPGATSPTFLTNASADGFATVYGYAAALPGGAGAVLGFRGTEGILDWILDFDFIPTPPEFPACPGCEVHEGFYRAWEALRGQAVAALAALGAGGASGLPVFVTGHSLGGAMANLAAFELAATGYTVAPVLYNFGQPRVGNPAYSAAYEAVVTNRTAAAASAGRDGAGTHSYRVVHHQDPVPQLPPQAFGFRHSPAEVWYNEAATSYTVCSTGNGEDPTCSDSNIDLNPEDHETYLGVRISGLC